MIAENGNKDVAFLEGHIKEHPDSILFARLADVYLELNRIDEAIGLCEKGLKKHPYYATGHFVLGKSYMAKKLYEQAEKEFKRVLLFDPKFLSAHKMYGDLMKEIGWENTCEMSYKKILQIDPLDETAREILGDKVIGSSSEEFPDEEREPPADALSGNQEENAFDFDALARGFEETSNPDDETGYAIEKDNEGKEEPESPPQADSSEAPNLDDISPVAVTEEEEDLLFEEPEAKTEEVVKTTMPQQPKQPELDEADAEEFSYILDDIFSDDADEGGREKSPSQSPVAGGSVDKDEPTENDVDDLLAELQLDSERSSSQPDVSLDARDEADTDTGITLPQHPEPFSDLPPQEELADSGTPAESDEAFPDFTSGTNDFPDIPSNGPESDDASEPPQAEIDSPEPKYEEPGSTEQQSARDADLEEAHPPAPEPPTSGRSGKKQDKIVTPTLGEIYAAQGQYSKAIDVFETLIKKHPDNEFYVQKIASLKRKLAETRDAS